MRRPGVDFDSMVREALALIPDEFRPYLANVPVLVEEEPDEELELSLGMEPGEGLYGVYLDDELPDLPRALVDVPGRIVLFRRCLLEDFDDPEELRREILITVVHEIAHHFGIGEERLEELGLD